MRIQDLSRLLTLAALWGGSFAFMRVAVPALGPIWLAESRVTIAFIALFAVALLRRGVPSRARALGADLWIWVLKTARPIARLSFAEQIN